MGRRLALLIATYEYQDTELRRLTAPAHDAESLAEVLGDPDIANFEVTTLVNEPLHRVGDAIGDLYRDRRRDDLTLLYFTGHGLKDDNGRLYLAMANTRRDTLLFTALAAEQIDQAMSGCMSRRQVLILDCCYSGAFPAGRLAKADPEVHTLERFHGRGRTVLTASDSTQYSFEGDTLRGEATQSVFTRYLVAGLRDGSADLDGDGDVTLDELYSYVYERVVAELPQQRPKKQDNVEGRTVIARNVNWKLPSYLRNALASPIPADRLNALDGLDHLHRIGNATVRATIRETLAALEDDDSRQVSAAAAARLAAIARPPTEAEPVPPQASEPAAPEAAVPEPAASEPAASEPAVPEAAVPEPAVPEPKPEPRAESLSLPQPEPASEPERARFTVARARSMLTRRHVLWLSAAVVVAAVATVVAIVVNNSNNGEEASGGTAVPKLSSMAVSPDGQYLYLTTAMPPRVSKISTTTWQAVAQRDFYVDLTANRPTGLAVSPDGAHLHIAGDSVVSFATDRMVESRRDDVAGQPAGVVVNPKADRAYVITQNPNNVVSIDTTSVAAKQATIPVNGTPNDVVVSPGGAHVYVGGPNFVNIIDTATDAGSGTIGVCADELAISPEGNLLYALCEATSEISIVDLATRNAERLVLNGGIGAVAVGADGLLYAAYSGASSMSVVNPATRQVVGKPIAIESGALAVVADPARPRAYTANENGTIYLVDTTKNTATKLPVRWSG